MENPHDDQQPTDKTDNKPGTPTLVGATEQANTDFPGQGPEYSSVGVEDFLTQIFGDVQTALVWASSKVPRYPCTWETFNKSMSRSRAPKACYFGTASMHLPEDGQPKNRQELFKALQCLVLDDIGSGEGSKCAVEDVPIVLREKASWIIETSPDNYQYGYLLAEPITDLYQAKQLVRLLYGAGKWDNGGAMPNKLVRLPCGVNLKKKYAAPGGALFSVHLVSDELFEWTPDQLLTAAGTGVTWADVVAHSGDKIDPKRRRGATAFREGVRHERQDGIVDDIFEWLSKEGYLLSETQEWQTIRCPWWQDHTEGIEAGYSPLGSGGGAYSNSRGFKCFHDHCSAHTTKDFLNWVASMGGPECSIHDPNPEFCARYAHNVKDATVVDLKSPALDAYRYRAFKDGHQDPLWVHRTTGPALKVPLFNYWNTNPNRVKVWGSVYHPGGARIVEQRGKLYVNLWSVPYWQPQKINPRITEGFQSFIEYLIPNPADSSFFLDHLAMKVQNPFYRGPAVILSTPVFGTGRGRLEHFIAQLWGDWNCSRVRLPEFLRGINASVFNAWLCSSFLCISESKDSALSATQSATAYETLKDYIEPGSVKMLIKNKWGTEGMLTCYSSVIVSTNHSIGIVTASGDRRFRRIENCTQARDSTYFGELMALIDSDPGSLWLWLAARDVSKFDAFYNPALKADMSARANATVEMLGVGIDAAVEWCLLWSDEVANGLILPQDCVLALRPLAMRFGFDKLRGDWEKVVHNALMEKTRGITRGGIVWQCRRGDTRIRPRHIMSDAGHATRDMIKNARSVRLEKLYNNTTIESWLVHKLEELGH